MMITTSPSPATDLSIDKNLANAEDVDGLALFGLRLGKESNPISDYDLLILLHEPPIRIFQMLTHINGRMADVVFAETDAVDNLAPIDPLWQRGNTSIYLADENKQPARVNEALTDWGSLLIV